MQITFKTDKQCKIAQLLWEAKNQQEVRYIFKIFGVDAHIVYNMIMASSLDAKEFTEEDLLPIKEMLLNI